MAQSTTPQPIQYNPRDFMSQHTNLHNNRVVGAMTTGKKVAMIGLGNTFVSAAAVLTNLAALVGNVLRAAFYLIAALCTCDAATKQIRTDARNANAGFAVKNFGNILYHAVRVLPLGIGYAITSNYDSCMQPRNSRRDEFTPVATDEPRLVLDNSDSGIVSNV